MSHALFLTNESQWSCRSYGTKLQDTEWETIYVNPVFLWDTVCQHCCICSTASDTQLTVAVFNTVRSKHQHGVHCMSVNTVNPGLIHLLQSASYPLLSAELHIPKGRLFRTIPHTLALLGATANPLPLHTHTHTQTPNPSSLPPNNTQPHVPAVHE